MTAVPHDDVRPGMTKGRRTLFLISMCVIIMTGLNACRDQLTSPTRNTLGQVGSLRPTYSFSEDPGYGEFDSPSSGSYDGVISTWDASATTNVTWDFHFPTIVRVVASGDVHQVPGLLHGDDLVWGPTGAGGQTAMAMLVDGGTVLLGTSPTAFLVQGGVQPFRTALNDPQPYGEPHWTCGRQFPDHDHPCWGFAGSAHAEFVRVPVGMTLARSGVGEVDENALVSFAAGMDSTTINGIPVNMSALKWRWQAQPLTYPDPVALADTIACTSTSNGSCTRQMVRSGVMYATAYVNGKQLEKSVTVQVHVAHLSLSGSPTFFRDHGDTATFVASGNGDSFSISSWWFVPDGGAASSWADCGSATTCERPVEQSGTVWVAGTVAGKSATARVSVTVVPCLSASFTGCEQLTPAQITELTVLLKSFIKKNSQFCSDRATQLSNMLGNNQIHSFLNETLRKAVGAELEGRIGIKLELFGGTNSYQLFITAMHEVSHTLGATDNGPDGGEAEQQARSCYSPPSGVY